MLTSPRLWNDIKNTMSQIFQPDEISKIARKAKFIQRSTSLLQAKEFVELMSVASLDSRVMTLERLCCKLRTLNPEADLTPQSLMERINRVEAAMFLKSVFLRTLEKGLTDIVERVPQGVFSQFNNVYIEDCSECALNEELQDDFKGSSGNASTASVKIDLIYELKRKNIFSVELTDKRLPDQKLAKKHLDITQKGDLWIRDLGFFDATLFKTIDTIGAFFLSRLLASALVYLNKEDQRPIDLAKYLNEHYSNQSVIDLQVFVTGEKLPCRLIAYRAPRELADKRRRDAKKEARAHGRIPTHARLNRLDFTFFITNVPKEVWEPEIVGTIYTARWQIELIFKNWKSSLQIHYLKGIDPDRIRCLLYGKLITIVVMHILYKLADWYAQKLGREASLHKVVNWLIDDNKLASAFLKGFKRALIVSLEMEVPKTLCKDKRKRKTTQNALETSTPYCELYDNLHDEDIENQYLKAA